MKNNIFSNA